MNVSSPSLTQLQACEPGPPAAAAFAQMAALASAQPVEAAAPGTLTQGFAQAMAAQQPVFADALALSGPQAGLAEVPTALAESQQASDLLPPLAGAAAAAQLVPVDAQDAKDSRDANDINELASIGVMSLDPTGQSALAAQLLWPAAMSMPTLAASLSASSPALPAAGRGAGLERPAVPESGAVVSVGVPSLSSQATSSAQLAFALPGADSSNRAPAQPPQGAPVLAGPEDSVKQNGVDAGSSTAVAMAEVLGGVGTAIGTPLSTLPDTAVLTGSDARLVLKGEARQWQQPLLQALGDRLQLQIAGRSEQAVIRLSPPMLGQVEIAIRQQAGELQVRLTASHGEVTRQLQQVSDTLRQDLVQRHSGEVTVQVSAAGRESESRFGTAREGQAQQQEQAQQQPQQQDGQSQRRPGRALQEAASDADSFAADLSRLERSS